MVVYGVKCPRCGCWHYRRPQWMKHKRVRCPFCHKWFYLEDAAAILTFDNLLEYQKFKDEEGQPCSARS